MASGEGVGGRRGCFSGLWWLRDPKKKDDAYLVCGVCLCHHTLKFYTLLKSYLIY